VSDRAKPGIAENAARLSFPTSGVAAGTRFLQVVRLVTQLTAATRPAWTSTAWTEAT